MRWAVFLLAGGCAGPQPELSHAGPALPRAAPTPAAVRAEPRPNAAWSVEPHAVRFGNSASSGPGEASREQEGDAAEAWSVARAGEPGALAWLQAGLAEVNRPSPALIAAHALLDRPAYASASAWTKAEHGWWGHYAVESDPLVQRAWLYVIARQGTAISQHRLAADLANLPAPSEAGSRHRFGFEAMGMACARGVAPSPEGVEALGLGLLGGPEIGRAAAYAVGRCARLLAEHLPTVDQHAWVGALSTLLTGPPDAAAVAWRALAALGRLPPEIADDVLLRPRAHPEAWLAEVEAVRAMALDEAGRRELVRRLLRAPPPEGARVHVFLEALRRLRGRVSAEPELLGELGPLGTALANGRGLAATWLACELELLRAIGARTTEALLQCGDLHSDVPVTWREELGVEVMYHVWRHGGPGRAEAVARLLATAEDPRAALAQAALSALSEVDDPRVNPVLRAGLQASDPGVRTAAAAVVAQRSEQVGRSDHEAIAPLVALLAESDVALLEARVSAVRALGALARSERVAGDLQPAWLGAALLPLALDPSRAVREAAYTVLSSDPTLRDPYIVAVATRPHREHEREASPAIALGAATTGLRVELERGAFTIHFRGPSAPLARAQFVALARRGFFDGSRIHRVVPGFVVQGGDPRGDGYGGPGTVLPCERGSLRFGRGTVGIASAGPDTGGSQFFVTTNEQPHLDGRFTVLGQVDAADQALVDAILPHERVLSLRPLEEAS